MKTAIIGLERNQFYMTYEPVGHMLKNSRGITPKNNILLDTFWGIAGSVSFFTLDLFTPVHTILTC
jgi:3-dehydrosphinganine reductase